ncbi:accessory gene regulator B family protein [Peptococcaceae bacterium 1198_IL3148]
MSYLSFSKRLANYLSLKTGLTSEQEIIITYAIEILVLNLINIVFTIALGALLGVLPGTMVALITVAAFRHTAGGAHLDSPVRCALLTIIIFPLIAIIAQQMCALSQIYIDIFMVLSIIIGLLTVILLAPVDSPGAPIISSTRRRRLKVLSIIMVVLIALVVVFLRESHWVYALQIGNCLALSVLWVSFILSGTGKWVMSKINQIKV